MCTCTNQVHFAVLLTSSVSIEKKKTLTPHQNRKTNIVGVRAGLCRRGKAKISCTGRGKIAFNSQ